MLKIRYTILCSLLLLIFSCVKDNTNNDFRELNDIMKIEGINDVYNVKIGDYLKIEPKLTSRFNDESNMEFIWYKYNTSSLLSMDTMSFEKNLNVKIIDVLPGVEHFIVFKVVDKKTNTYERVTMKLNTSGIYSKGIVALVKEDGKTDLSFIADGDKNVIKNLYSEVNDGEILSDQAKKVFCLNTSPDNASGQYKKVIVTVNDKTAGVVIDPVLFTKVSPFIDMFLFPIQGDKNEITANAHGLDTEVFIMNGLVYDRKFSAEDVNERYLNSTPIACNVKPNEYSLSPIILTSRSTSDGPLFFDDLNGRFMRLESGQSNFSFYRNSDNAFSFFNPGDLKGMKLMSGGLVSDYNNLWTIMRENSGQMRLLTIYDSKINWVPKFMTTQNSVISQTDCPMLYKANEIVSTSYTEVKTSYPYIDNVRGAPGLAIYIVNNNVYAFNVSSKSEFILINGDAENLTIEKALCHSIKTINADNTEEWNTRIGLCVKDNSLSKKKGGVVYYKINYVGGVSVTQTYKNTGFCDEVIHFDYKAD